MLQINNVDEGKSEWNLNETHIIIPVIDGDETSKEPDKILTNTLTLSSLSGGDQTILANALEHSFVIGLDKNHFETPNYKSDLVIIQNSDVKLTSGQTDLKNSVAYTISYLDQERNEILWRPPLSKDRISTSDKAILEVKDVLNYDDSVHDLDKTEEQINLNTVIESQIVKTSSNILLEKTVCCDKKEKKIQYYNYFPASQNTETVLEQLVPSKSNENLELEERKFLDFKSHTNLNVDDYSLDRNVQGSIFNVTKSLYNETHPVEIIACETDEKKKIIVSKNKDSKVENAEREKIIEKGNNLILEKSLPLKKKAKMKRTLISFSFENQKSLMKQDVVTSNQQVDIKFSRGKKVKSLTTASFHKDQNSLRSDSDEPLINKATKRKKATKFNLSSKKLKKSVYDFQVQENEEESQKFGRNKFEEEDIKQIEHSAFDRNKCNNINDLIDSLRKSRMINTLVWQTLNSGLKEIKVDILKEMNAKKCEKSSPESTNYSPQLKAFALVLYFKQPAAFNYLSQVYKNGWPSLNVIKKWKRRMNSSQRPDFCRDRKKYENCKQT